jgi:hypothetical protein
LNLSSDTSILVSKFAFKRNLYRYTPEVRSIGPDGLLRTAVVSRKLRPTPEKYPRRAGLPNKRPL